MAYLTFSNYVTYPFDIDALSNIYFCYNITRLHFVGVYFEASGIVVFGKKLVYNQTICKLSTNHRTCTSCTNVNDHNIYVLCMYVYAYTYCIPPQIECNHRLILLLIISSLAVQLKYIAP